MAEHLTLVMADDVRIVVPDDLGIVTPYVLLEQHDWFEDEIRFVRAFVRPGMRAVDVGANFGVYTLTLARRVAATGRVWAIEPGEDATRYLARSIAANNFTNVEQIRCALSRFDGAGYIDTAVDPEYRRLESGASSVNTEVRTLDRLAAERGIERVDFVKIDVEGEEANVIEGGADFLAREHPLLMLEIKSGEQWNWDVFEPLIRLGYESFRLVPGINVLVPFYESEEVDPYQLNIFACGQSRAGAIGEMGYLAAGLGERQPEIACKPELEVLFERPYARRWRGQAGATGCVDTDKEYLEALRWFLAAHARANSPQARYWAIQQAYLRLHALLLSGFTLARGASFVRVAAEYGRRAEAVAVSRQLVTAIIQQGGAVFDKPILAPWPYHDAIDPDPEPRQWLLASALESCEHLGHFSSYYKPALAQEELGARVDPRFLSPSYLRRERLMQQRAGRTASTKTR